jgi:Trypsin
VYGVSILNNQEKMENAEIEDIFVHKQFKEEHWFYKYDISVIKTAEKLRLQPRLAEIKAFADPGVRHPPGTTCMLGGYGLSAYPNLDAGPSRLRMITLQIISDEECAGYTKLLPGMFCASSSSTGVCNVSLQVL